MLWVEGIPAPPLPTVAHDSAMVSFADGMSSSRVEGFRLRRIARTQSLALRRSELAWQRNIARPPSPVLAQRVYSDVVTADDIDTQYAHSLLSRSLASAAVEPEAPKPELPFRDSSRRVHAMPKLPEHLENWPQYLPPNHRPNCAVSAMYTAYPRPPSPMPPRCRLEDVEETEEANDYREKEMWRMYPRPPTPICPYYVEDEELQQRAVTPDYREREMWGAYPRAPTPMPARDRYFETAIDDSDDDDNNALPALDSSSSRSLSSSDQDDDNDNEPSLTLRERAQLMHETHDAILAKHNRRIAEWHAWLERFRARNSVAEGQMAVVEKQVRFPDEGKDSE